MLESGQIPGQGRCRIGICNGLREVIASHGLAVMARKVKLHTPGKTFAALQVGGRGHQGLHHANDFRALLVDGDGVKIVDFDITVGPYRVRHGARVFGKLHGPQHAHVFDAFDGAGAGIARHVLAELLVAKDRQAFFE